MKVGLPVIVEGVRGEFTVSAGPNRKGEFEVRRGNLSMWVAGSRLQETKTQAKATKKPKFEQDGGKLPRPRAGKQRDTIRLDLHGLTVAEARERLETALDDALLEGAQCLEILHGLGSGKLMKAVHDYLAASRHIKNYTIAPGNPGLTIAYI